ncbi:flagellar assembly protein FliH [Proteus myxofaciens]|uniref:Flagellar assembly protein FliH n=1 Tax=Proteus myxofaciens ATCC 19692 TaxID=1354337 RepID=A0A198GGY7_9GAMM|nr:flagellar assembly protein FliH [Proteus myxofaciens]OAT36712.1 FliH family flagellar assembly protein [Proteus myxofaciens ATCC 19692]
MSDKHTDNWKPWVPKELTDWELKAETPVENEIKIEKQEKEVVQQQKVLEQINMLDDMKEKAQKMGHAEGFEAGKNQGYQEGYQAGLQAGIDKGTQQGIEQQAPLINEWQGLLAEFKHSLDGLDSVIASRLMQIALTAAKEVLGQPAVCDGSALLAQINLMLQQEQMFSGDPQLRVNPKHIPLIEKELGDSLSAHGWKVVADNSIHIGGCRVVTNDGDLDSTIATRWHELCRLAAPEAL